MVRVWRSCAKTGELFWFDSQGSRVFGERVRVFLGVQQESLGGGLAKEKVRTGRRGGGPGGRGKFKGNGEGAGGGVEPCGGTEGTGEAWHGNACQVCAL